MRKLEAAVDEYRRSALPTLFRSILGTCTRPTCASSILPFPFPGPFPRLGPVVRLVDALLVPAPLALRAALSVP